MKLNQLILPFISLFLLLQCNAEKKAIRETKVIRILASEMYCGGAAPPEELLKELNTKKPLINKDIEVFLNSKFDARPVIFKTNDKGEISIPRKLGNKIFISVYPSEDIFNKDAGNDKNYTHCYTDFITRNLMEVKMRDKIKEVEVSVFIICNPCLPPAP